MKDMMIAMPYRGRGQSTDIRFAATEPPPSLTYLQRQGVMQVDVRVSEAPKAGSIGVALVADQDQGLAVAEGGEPTKNPDGPSGYEERPPLVEAGVLSGGIGNGGAMWA